MADYAILLHFLDAHEQGTVVHHQGITGFHIAHQAGVVDRGGERDRSFGALTAELHLVALFQVVGLFKFSGADGWAGEIEEHGDVGIPFFGFRADKLRHLRRPLMLGMAHVQSENIHPAVDEAADHFLFLGGGAEGDDELRFTGHGERN